MTKKKISRQDAIYSVALAGISAALALLLVWLSVLLRYGTLGFFAAAGLVVMIPLYKKYYVSAIFAYAVSAGLSVLVGDLASVMGYILYFGPIALLIGVFVNKNVKWFVSLPIQIAYAVCMLAVLYFAFGSVIVGYDALQDIKFWIVAVVGTPVLVGINFVMMLAYSRIVPRVASALRDNKNQQSIQSDLPDDDESPFEEFDVFVKHVNQNEDDKSGENNGEENESEN